MTALPAAEEREESAACESLEARRSMSPFRDLQTGRDMPGDATVKASGLPETRRAQVRSK